MKLVTLAPWLLLGPLIVLSAPQYRQRMQGQGGKRGRGQGGGARLRQNQVGRRVAVIPEYEEKDGYGEEHDDDGGYESPSRYTEEEPSGYGYTRDSNEYVERRGGGVRRAQGRGDGRGSAESTGRRQGSGERRGSEELGGNRQEGRGMEENQETGQGRTIEETLKSSEESNEEKGEEVACGPECRNLMHESEHPEEDDICPYEGMVIDIWGYCRYQFEEERRDWRWWETIRQYMHSTGNSWANRYAPTIHQQMYHQG